MAKKRLGFRVSGVYRVDPEKDLIVEILKTARMQIRKRKKAGHSWFYIDSGKLIEAFPDTKEIEKRPISEVWLEVEPQKRFFVLE